MHSEVYILKTCSLPYLAPYVVFPEVHKLKITRNSVCGEGCSQLAIFKVEEWEEDFAIFC